ncbi:unnamed protein product [Prorocentrum cordatum]|uniref:Uncharacterized protein n=1 Tax=Prorocentrum cordatum TaxID=2364126 RepID=A0ABN9SXZ6_9DINO|nr:unnamed protein product [Polarella glacialis]
MIEGGKAYEADSKGMRAEAAKGNAVDWKARGPPFVHVFMAACSYIADKKEKMTDPTSTDREQAKISKEMKEFFTDKLEKINVEETADLIMYFRVRMQKKFEGQEQKATVLIRFNPSNPLTPAIANHILRTIEIEGGTKLRGAAPRGPLEREREISRLL